MTTELGPRDQGKFNGMLHVYAAFSLAIVAPMYGRLEHRRSFLAILETITVIAFVFACVGGLGWIEDSPNGVTLAECPIGPPGTDTALPTGF